MCLSAYLRTGMAGMFGTVVLYVEVARGKFCRQCRVQPGRTVGRRGGGGVFAGHFAVSVKGVRAVSRALQATRYTGLPGPVAVAHNG